MLKILKVECNELIIVLRLNRSWQFWLQNSLFKNSGAKKNMSSARGFDLIIIEKTKKQHLGNQKY